MVSNEMPVLCIGQIVADVVVRPVDSLPTVGDIQRVRGLDLVAGGCAVNTACVLSKLGLNTWVIGAMGTDALGEAVLSQLSDCGVNTSQVVRLESAPTSAVIVLVDSRGERLFLYRDGGNELLTSEMIPESALRAAGIVHVGGAMKLSNLDLAHLLRRARAAGAVTSLDTDWDMDGRWLEVIEPALPHIDYLFSNEQESHMLTGTVDPWEAGRKLIAKGPRAVIIKRGSKGAVAVTPEMEQAFPTYDVPVVDTTCAGDAFSAGFLYGLTRNWSVQDAVRFANAAGAVSTTQISHRGVESLSSMMSFVRSRPQEIPTEILALGSADQPSGRVQATR